MRRIFHHWQKWECVAAGMYETTPPRPQSADDAVRAYAAFLRDLPRFRAALTRVLNEWPISCEHFLSNESQNRIAWLGQASMCIDSGVPSRFRRGFMLLDDAERRAANLTAFQALQRWLGKRGATVAWQMSGDMGDTDNGADDSLRRAGGLHCGVAKYIRQWRRRDYTNGVPDEVPGELMSERLAPSYRAIGTAILKNDHALLSLGFDAPPSRWYGALKRIEIAARPRVGPQQLSLW